jgi:hypothetical protein
MKLHHARLTWAKAVNAIVGAGRHPLLVSGFSGQAKAVGTPLVQVSCEHHPDVTIREAS